MKKKIFGIDYGSKLSGNTVIAVYADGEVMFLDVKKDVDADQFILNAVDHFKPSLVFIDAPLSLPGIYSKLPNCSNYHFRKADIELNAMSPMFIGGLAARAIQLKDDLEGNDIEVYETYPKVIANRLNLKSKGYKCSRLGLKDCKKELIKHIPQNIDIDYDDIKNWHFFDALLALVSALNFCSGNHDIYGDPAEGAIFI